MLVQNCPRWKPRPTPRMVCVVARATSYCACMAWNSSSCFLMGSAVSSTGSGLTAAVERKNAKVSQQDRLSCTQIYASYCTCPTMLMATKILQEQGRRTKEPKRGKTPEILMLRNNTALIKFKKNFLVGF